MDWVTYFIENTAVQFLAVALTLITGYFFLHEKISSYLKKRFKDPNGPITFPNLDVYRSNFANEPAEVETVLNIRRSYFGNDTITSDEAYYNCWRQNSDCFKVIYDDRNRPIGYWGIIPTLGKTYELFLDNILLHEQILNDHVISWREAAHNECYLYIIGAVVPKRMKLIELSSDNNKIRAAYVISDIIKFALYLKQYLDINGVYGYPSKDGGLGLLNRFGFLKNGKYIENNPKQPICYVPKSEIDSLFERMQANLLTVNRYSPEWDLADKKRFTSKIT